MADNKAALAAVETDLRRLGRCLDLPEPPDTAVEAVMERLAGEPAPATPSLGQRIGHVLASAARWVRNRWRIASAVLVGVLLAVFVASPAGAGVREWFGFGAVVVQEHAPSDIDGSLDAGSRPPDGTSAPSADGTEMSLDQARASVSFAVGVPGALGEPDSVTVSGDGRVVTMRWFDGADGPILLNQIAGSPDPIFFKKYFQDVDYTVVGGGEALWLAKPHPIVVLDPDGSQRLESARQSGPSLVWQHAGVTLRLEGVGDRARAVAIAESLPE